MTRRTEKFVLDVFEYCCRLAVVAKREGKLILEEYLSMLGLSEGSPAMFNKKIDKYLRWAIRFIIDGAFSAEANNNLLKSIGRFAGRRTKIALNVAAICMDSIANDKDFDIAIARVSAYVDVEKIKIFREVRDKANSWYYLEKDGTKSLTDEQKQRVVEINQFLKWKEDECDFLLKQKFEDLCKMQSKVPEMTSAGAHIWFQYNCNPKKGDDGIWLYIKTLPDEDSDKNEKAKPECFIGDIPVCGSLYRFWNSYKLCGRNIEKFMNLAQSVSKLELCLEVGGKIRLWSEV